MRITNQPTDFQINGPTSPEQLAMELLEAVKSQDVEKVKALTSQGRILIGTDDVQRTPMHWAAEGGSYEIVDLLIKNKMGVNGEYNKTFYRLKSWCSIMPELSPLTLAINNGHIDIAKLLIENGAKLHFEEFESAISKGYVELAGLILDKIQQTTPEPLWGFMDNAIEMQDVKAIDLLIKKDPCLVNAQGKGFSSPLHRILSSSSIDLEIIKLLIRNGANPNAIGPDFKTPVHLAVENGCSRAEEILKLLAEGEVDLDLTIKDAHGRTPLHAAIGSRLELEILTLLVGNKSDLNLNITDNRGNTLLHLAITEAESPTSVAQILIDHGADLEVQDTFDRRTPLHLAIEKGKIDIVKLLIAKQKNLELTNREGKNPMHLAAALDRKEIVMLLIEAGANVEVAFEVGLYPIHYSILKEDIKMTTLLIEKGANLNSGTMMTPLFTALVMGQYEALKLLIENGAELPTNTHTREERSADYALLTPVLSSLVKYSDIGARSIIAEALIDAIHISSSSWGERLEYVKIAIEKEEGEVLAKRLKEKLRPDMEELKNKIAKVKRSLKKEETPILIEELAHLTKDLNALKDSVKKATNLVVKARRIAEKNPEGARGLIEEAEKLVKVRENLTYDATVASFLIGRMAGASYFQGNVIERPTKSDVEAVIGELVSYKGLKDDHERRMIALIALSLSQVQDLTDIKKIAILKKLIQYLKNPSINTKRMLAMVSILVKLKDVGRLETFLSTEEDPFSYLKKSIEELSEEKFGLKGMKDFTGKFNATFGNPKLFRDPEAIFIYLASISSHPDEDKAKSLVFLFSTYLEDVLEGRFHEQRYDFEKNNVHLKKIFNSKPVLLRKWQQNKSLPIQDCVKKVVAASSDIDYRVTFQEKIDCDCHLGQGWKEEYPYLAAVFGSQKSINEGIAEVSLELATKQQSTETTVDSSREVRLLEAQKLILTLCQNSDSSKEMQRELLEKAHGLFAGTTLQNDIKGLIDGLSTEKGAFQKDSNHTVCDSDDPCDILLMGHEINGSCQGLDLDPRLNQGLLGPLLDGKYRVIAVKNDKGEMIARCLLKILWDDQQQEPVLFQERIYINQPNNKAYHTEALNEMCKQKAIEMNLPLLKLAEGKSRQLYPYPVKSVGGRSDVEYVDALRGIVGNCYEISRPEIIWQPESSFDETVDYYN